VLLSLQRIWTGMSRHAGRRERPPSNRTHWPAADAITDSRLQRYRLPIGGFGHPKSEDDQCHEGGSAQCEKRRAISEMIDDHASSQPAQRGANPLDRGDGALGRAQCLA
jgi:hypothetical protein